MDRLLDEKSEYKYFVLPADSGMGKSAFVLNYYARHLKRARNTGRKSEYIFHKRKLCLLSKSEKCCKKIVF